jgi:hypothetical protein
MRSNEEFAGIAALQTGRDRQVIAGIENGLVVEIWNGLAATGPWRWGAKVGVLYPFYHSIQVNKVLPIFRRFPFFTEVAHS